MKIILLVFTFLSLTLIQCVPNSDHPNGGSQASQDSPSTRERDIYVDSVPTHDTSASLAPTDSNTGLKSEAPNNGNKNPHQSIQGQNGSNQTGSK
jgi:hypothetical protein